MKRIFFATFPLLLPIVSAAASPALIWPLEPLTNRASLGASLLLSVQATGTVSTLNYQWRFNSLDLPAETNATLSLIRIQTNQAGVYTVLVSDEEGAVTSPPRTITVGTLFRKVSTSPLVSASSTFAIAWADYNRDGYPDVFCAQRNSGSGTLFTNDGTGNFGRAPGSVGVGLVNPLGAAWGDYDNKGCPDLFVAINSSANDALWHNNADGTFTRITTGSVVNSAGNGNGCSWADYDRDGFLDLYVANSDGNNFLFHNQRDGTFLRITSGAAVSGTGYSQGCQWIDYDGDGYPDLFVSRYQTSNLLFHNNRNGTFSNVTGTPLTTQAGTGLGFCWGDFDNDGLPDLFVANGGTNNYLFHNDGNGSFSRTNSPTGVDSGSFQTANWVDYDNDGWLDLFVTSVATGGICHLYHNNADGTFTRESGSSLVSEAARWFASAWADLNHDGFPDVFVSSISGPNSLNLNLGNDNHWLTVRCLGRLSNRSAIGTKLRLYATIFGRSFWQVREISGGGNIGCQDQLEALFGLGDAATADTLRIEWPSGAVQEFHEVTGDRILQASEPALLTAPNRTPDGAVQFTLNGGIGVVYGIETSTNLNTWEPWRTLTNRSLSTVVLDPQPAETVRLYRAVEY